MASLLATYAQQNASAEAALMREFAGDGAHS
jgi:hypothetical protein